MLRRFSVNFAIFSMILDFFIVMTGLLLAEKIRPLLNALPMVKALPGTFRMPPPLYGVFPLVFLVVLATTAIYDGRKYLRAVDEFGALSLAFLIASVSCAGILYLSYREISRALFLLFLVLTYGGLVSWRGLVRVFFRTRKDWPDDVRRVVVVGAGPLGQRVKDQILNNQNVKFSLVDLVSDNGDSGGDGSARLRAIRQTVLESGATDVVIALPHSAYNRLGEVVGCLGDVPVHVWLALGFFDLALYETALEDFAGIPMLDLRATALSDIQLGVKRAFDILVGIPLTLLALPIMGLAALAIWLEDGSPVLFKQQRAGENGRLFTVLKFRTMVKNAEQLREQVETVDAEGNLIHKKRNDPRVTRVGRFLRRTSLDELPQLFNVLQGRMSLVGPRPELPYLVEKYQPWQRKRFAVPPGITGWWQVNGRSDNPMHLHSEDDLYYIRNYSIWLDIQIIIRTIWVVLIGRGSY